MAEPRTSAPARPEPAVPAPVARVAAGRPVRLIWHNEAGGLTYEVGAGTGRWFVKWSPVSSGIDLAGEAARLAWARPFTPVPLLLGQGADETASWLVTAALPGRSAVDGRWLAEPRTAVIAIGAGLRAMHEALPVPACPFSWSAGRRIADIRRRASQGRLNMARLHEEHRRLGVGRALEMLAEIPGPEQVVVCHGDSCAPNTLLTDDGRWSGHVDLGDLGVADRWADLAVASWSTEWNYGPGWDGLMFSAYGVRPDPDRVSYYRLLWDFGP